jgi:predicted transcriptional regulator
MRKEEMSEFQSAQQLASLAAKDYARDFFRLLVIYKDISASEAAARLNLHIKTAQDFLDGLEEAGIVSKHEALEKKRPYYRYSLEKTHLSIEIDLDALYRPDASNTHSYLKIREHKNSGVLFKEGRDNQISSLSLFEGKGRSRTERKINLTRCQGRFLFYLPFPTEPPQTVKQICEKAGLSEECMPEIDHLLEILIHSHVIETHE